MRVAGGLWAIGAAGSEAETGQLSNVNSEHFYFLMFLTLAVAIFNWDFERVLCTNAVMHLWF